MVSGAAVAQEKELVFGPQCDRTGATQTVGVFLCPGYHDYIALVNSKGGIEGFKIRVIEIDHEYKVPRPWKRTSASRRKVQCSRASTVRRRRLR